MCEEDLSLDEELQVRHVGIVHVLDVCAEGRGVEDEDEEDDEDRMRKGSKEEKEGEGEDDEQDEERVKERG